MRSKTLICCIASLIAVTFFLTACAGGIPNPFKEVPTEPEPGMSQEQFRLVKLAAESERIKGQGLFGGAAAGTLLSFLVCQDQPIWCYAGVTALGAGAGYAAGYYLAEKKKDEENEQASIEQSIEAAQGSLAFYEKRADASEKVVASNRRKITELNRQLAAGQIEAAAYRKKYDTMHDDRARIASMSDQLSSDIRFLEVESEARRQFADEDVSELQARKRTLERINTRMKAQLAALDEELERVPGAITS